VFELNEYISLPLYSLHLDVFQLKNKRTSLVYNMIVYMLSSNGS